MTPPPRRPRTRSAPPRAWPLLPTPRGALDGGDGQVDGQPGVGGHHGGRVPPEQHGLHSRKTHPARVVPIPGQQHVAVRKGTLHAICGLVRAVAANSLADAGGGPRRRGRGWHACRRCETPGSGLWRQTHALARGSPAWQRGRWGRQQQPRAHRAHGVGRGVMPGETRKSPTRFRLLHATAAPCPAARRRILEAQMDEQGLRAVRPPPKCPRDPRTRQRL